MYRVVADRSHAGRSPDRERAVPAFCGGGPAAAAPPSVRPSRRPALGYVRIELDNLTIRQAAPNTCTAARTRLPVRVCLALPRLQWLCRIRRTGTGRRIVRPGHESRGG